MERPADVFLNIPFDRSYERMLVALVAGLTALRLKPRSVLEASPYASDRLTRLKELIRSCRYSIHDLSRRAARFNMPFELGLTLGLHDGAERHTWVVLDGKRHALKACLSDIDGYDVVQIHGGHPTTLLQRLHQVFYRRDVAWSDIELAHLRLRQFVAAGLAGDLLTKYGFRRLTLAASRQVELLRGE